MINCPEKMHQWEMHKQVALHHMPGAAHNENEMSFISIAMAQAPNMTPPSPDKNMK